MGRMGHQDVVGSGSNQPMAHTAEQGNLLRDISHRQLSSDNQARRNHKEIVSMLEGLKMESRHVFGETFGAIQDVNKTSREGCEEIQDLVRAGQKTESECCDETRSMIRDLEENMIQPTDHLGVFLQAFLGSTFYQALRSLVRQSGQGILICVAIGSTFSVLYFVSDLYIFYYRQRTAKGFLRTVLYLLATCTRFLFPMGIVSSYLFLMGHVRNQDKMPFLTLFEKLPTSDKSSRQAVWFYQGVRVLAHPLRLYLAFLGLRFTKTRILMAGHQFGSFSILLGSTIFFTYFRIKMDQVYHNQNGNAGDDAKTLARQVFLLTTGMHPLVLIREEVSFVRSIITRPVKRKSDPGRSEDGNGSQGG